MYRTCAALLVVALAACSGSDSGFEPTSDTEATAAETTTAPSGDPQPYIDVLVVEIANDPEFPIADDEAECIARSTVETLGVDELESAGVGPEELVRVGALADLGIELAADFTDQLAARFVECADFGAVVVAGVVADLGVAEGSLDCMADEVDRVRFSTFLADSLVTGGDSSAAGEAFGQDLALSLSDECSKDFFLAVGVSDGAIDETQRACLDEQLEPAVAKQLIGAQVEGPEAADAAITAARPALVACEVDIGG